jgi:hypothetical protein
MYGLLLSRIEHLRHILDIHQYFEHILHTYTSKYVELGLPFSDKNIIPRNTEQIVFPSEFCLFREREKPSELRFEPFFGREKPRTFVPNHFWKSKTS